MVYKDAKEGKATKEVKPQVTLRGRRSTITAHLRTRPAGIYPVTRALKSISGYNFVVIMASCERPVDSKPRSAQHPCGGQRHSPAGRDPRPNGTSASSRAQH